MTKLSSGFLAAFVALAASPCLTTCAGTDASIHLTWTIDGEEVTREVCETAGALNVRIVRDKTGNGHADWESRLMPCMNRSGETLRVFPSDEPIDIAFELRGDAMVLVRVPETGWRSETLETGTNEMTVDFVTTSP